MNIRCNVPEYQSIRIRVIERRQHANIFQRWCMFILLFIILVLLFCIVIVLTMHFSSTETSDDVLHLMRTSTNSPSVLRTSTSYPQASTVMNMSTTTKSSEIYNDLAENRSLFHVNSIFFVLFFSYKNAFNTCTSEIEKNIRN